MTKKTLHFVLFLIPIAAIAGFFLGMLQLEILPDDQLESILTQYGSKNKVILLSVLQACLNVIFFGFLGSVLSNKIGLWRPIKFEKGKLKITLLLSIIGGIFFSLDPWIFGKFIKEVSFTHKNFVIGLSGKAFISSILYGGIIEELMMRLFFMSLLVFIFQKLFFRSQQQIPEKVLVIANIISSLAFAAGHLPATIAILGSLTPIIIFRCFLLNGCFGLLFGWFYKKYGIHYAMLSHALLHLVSKSIWLYCV